MYHLIYYSPELEFHHALRLLISFKSIQGCQAHQIFIFLDSFSEHVLLGGCRGFSRIFQPLKIAPASLISSSSNMEGIPFSMEQVQMPAMDDQSTHLVPIGYFVSSPIFLTEKESWSPSIYSWTPNHWLPLFFFQRQQKKRTQCPLGHCNTNKATNVSESWCGFVFVKFTDKMFRHK